MNDHISSLAALIPTRLAGVALVVMTLMTVGTAARQQPRAQQIDQTFRRLDRNGDGKLSRVEARKVPGVNTTLHRLLRPLILTMWRRDPQTKSRKYLVSGIA